LDGDAFNDLLPHARSVRPPMGACLVGFAEVDHHLAVDVLRLLELNSLRIGGRVPTGRPSQRPAAVETMPRFHARNQGLAGLDSVGEAAFPVPAKAHREKGQRTHGHLARKLLNLERLLHDAELLSRVVDEVASQAESGIVMAHSCVSDLRVVCCCGHHSLQHRINVVGLPDALSRAEVPSIGQLAVGLAVYKLPRPKQVP
jgi:hypothetical protein